MNILFKSVFIMFFALFIFVSNGVAQEALSDSNAAFLSGTFLATIQNADIEDLEYVAELLELGLADINAERLGRNALMLVANNNDTDGRMPMLKLLLSYGIDINAQDGDGRTALSYHGNYNENEDELSEEQVFLIQAGAQWSDADKEPFDFDRWSDVESSSFYRVLDRTEEFLRGRYIVSTHSRVQGEMIIREEPPRSIINPNEMLIIMGEEEQRLMLARERLEKMR